MDRIRMLRRYGAYLAAVGVLSAVVSWFVPSDALTASAVTMTSVGFLGVFLADALKDVWKG